ncbi:MAG: hypothetical protein AAFY78_22850 [Cyanobacteria bacterium J06648_16]
MKSNNGRVVVRSQWSRVERSGVEWLASPRNGAKRGGTETAPRFWSRPSELREALLLVNHLLEGAT